MSFPALLKWRETIFLKDGFTQEDIQALFTRAALSAGGRAKKDILSVQ
jgi:hypothetical protein